MSKKQRPDTPSEIPNTTLPPEIDPVDPSEIEDPGNDDEPEIEPVTAPDIEPEEDPEIDPGYPADPTPEIEPSTPAPTRPM
jgi:hypothetical protein